MALLSTAVGVLEVRGQGPDWSPIFQTAPLVYLDGSCVHFSCPKDFMVTQGRASFSPKPSLSRGGKLQMTHMDCCESCIPELSLPIPRGQAKLIFLTVGVGM